MKTVFTKNQLSDSTIVYLVAEFITVAVNLQVKQRARTQRLHGTMPVTAPISPMQGRRSESFDGRLQQYI